MGNWVGVSAIGQVERIRAREPRHRWDRVACCIVTTSEFTPTAREEAREILDLRLVDHVSLRNIVRRERAHDLIEDHWNSPLMDLWDSKIEIDSLKNKARARGWSFDEVDDHVEWLQDYGRVYRSGDTIYKY